MGDNARFGYLPATIDMKNDCVDGELLVDRSNGHIFIKKEDGGLASKTMDNEIRLDYNDLMDTHSSNLHIMLGAYSDWSKTTVCYPYDALTYNSTKKAIELSIKPNNDVKILFKNLISYSKDCDHSISLHADMISSHRKFNVSVFCTCFDNNHDFIVNKSVDLKNVDISKASFILDRQFLAKDMGTTQTAFIQIGLLIGNDTTTEMKMNINKFEIFQVPRYLQENSGLKGVYVDIDPNNDALKGTRVDDPDTTTGKAISNSSSSTINNVICEFVTTKLKYCDYSLAMRLKSSINDLTAQCLKIAISKNTGTETSPVWTPISDKNYPLTIFKNPGKYFMIYTDFDYTNPKAVNDMIKIELQCIKNTTPFTISLDYLTILPSVVGSFSI